VTYSMCLGQGTTSLYLALINPFGSAGVNSWIIEKTVGMLNYSIVQSGNNLFVNPERLGGGQFTVQAQNSCGISSPIVVHLNITTCDGGVWPIDPPGLPTNLSISPNPTSGETTLSIETNSTEKAFAETTEWDLEVYDNMQSQKLKKQKLKGSSATINTQSWKEGVYMVRVKYKDEMLTGKLVVKK
ncbi:MAG: T9SS type A sorting domain-containing protein, partial [Draconibacterium sp.]